MARNRPRFSLIEAALLLSLLAVVLAVFVPTFVRRVRTNKISEASEQLANMSRGAQAYFATAWSQNRRDCLPPSAGPTPEAPTVDARAIDFFSVDTPGHATWEALSFQPDRAVRFSYRYTTGQAGCGLREAVTDVAVTFRAEGDLDGDGVLSTFERRASIDHEGFKPAESLLVHQRTE